MNEIVLLAGRISICLLVKFFFSVTPLKFGKKLNAIFTFGSYLEKYEVNSGKIKCILYRKTREIQ